MSVIVREAHVSTYPEPLRGRAGDRFAFERRESEWEGWLWCTADGRSGWVPEAWVTIENTTCVLRRDYDATELSVEAGARLEIETRESGWAWARDADGRRGWVPLRCLEDAAEE